MISPESPNASYGPALQKMLAAFPQSKEKHNGYYEHADNPRFDFRVRENGSIFIHSWTGRTEDEILAMGGLKRSDISLNGHTYPGPTKDTCDVLDVAIAKSIDSRFLNNLGILSGYRYKGRNCVMIPYFNADGTQHTKMKVRKAVNGDYKQVWDEGTPGEIIPYGLHKLDMAREQGYLLIGEGESDAWTCWYHGIPYLGVPGSDMQKTLTYLDVKMLPAKIYILLESDQKQRLLDNGQGFYKNIHNILRAMGYLGEISCIDFKKATNHKDPSDLHIALCKENQAKKFYEIIEQTKSQAIPANDMQETPPIWHIQDERVLKAFATRDKQAIYALAQEITEMDEMEQSRIRLAAHDVFGRDFPIREFDGLLRAAKFENERKKVGDPCPISAYDLMRKQFPAIEYAVPDILPMGLIILGGKQKIGKSWLDLNLSLAVATGGIALSKYQVAQGDVLYLALEDTERRLQDRIGQLLGPGSEAPKNLHIETKWPRMDTKGIAALEKWLIEHPRSRMVIIDPWVKVKPRVRSRNGETGYDADYEALAGIKELADKYNVCILIQFHLRKANADDPFDEVNATTGATACADGFISIKRSRNEAEATLYASGRDYKEEINLALSFKGGMWKVLGDEQTAVYYTLSPERRAVIDLLCGKIDPYGNVQPTMPKDIATLLMVDGGAMRKMLFKMKEDNQVQWVGKDKERGIEEGYVSLIPSPKVEENKISMCGNAGNAGNSGNSGNSGNGMDIQAQPERFAEETVTDRYHRYRDEEDSGNATETASEAVGDTIEGGSVTTVTSVTAHSQKQDNVIPLPGTLSHQDTSARAVSLTEFWEAGAKYGYPAIPDLDLRSGKMGWNSFSLTHRLRMPDVIARLGDLSSQEPHA